MSLISRFAASSRSIAAGVILRRTAFAVIFPLLTLSVSAQIGGTGSMQGTVTDPTGANVPGATITATNAGTNAVITQQTSSSGFYSIAALPPGQYSVTVTAPGFQQLSQKNVVVDALAVATVNLTLTVGSATDVVTVTEAPPQLRHPMPPSAR